MGRLRWNRRIIRLRYKLLLLSAAGCRAEAKSIQPPAKRVNRCGCDDPGICGLPRCRNATVCRCLERLLQQHPKIFDLKKKQFASIRTRASGSGIHVRTFLRHHC